MMRETRPLSWPPGWKRTRYRDRGAKFFLHLQTFEDARHKLADELRLLGAQNAVLSLNVDMADDPGMALYFRRNGQQFVIASDRYDNWTANCRSIGIAISAMRDLERHGGGALVDRALTGFAALPPPPGNRPSKHWRDVLGLDHDAYVDRETIEAAYRTQARKCHPDAGGTNEAMAELNAARDQALREIRGRQQNDR